MYISVERYILCFPQRIAVLYFSACGEPDIYIDAVVDVGGNLQGDIRHYTCNKGLKTVGDASVTCLESGLWSPRQFECASK